MKGGTHEGACSRRTLLQHAPGAKLPRLHQRFVPKKNVAQQNFCSLISNWFDMTEQAPGANLLHESVSVASSLVCTEICLREMTCLQLASQIGLFFSSTTHCVELTFKMAAEGVEEDSVQIIDNKKKRRNFMVFVTIQD